MVRGLLRGASTRAKNKGLPFSITLEDIGPIPTTCPVLGIPLNFNGGKATDASPTLDRVVPVMGYVPGNILVISMRANRLKSNGSPWELKRIAEFYEEYINEKWMKT